MPGTKDQFLAMLDQSAAPQGAPQGGEEDPLAGLLPDTDATTDPAAAALAMEQDVDPTTQEGATFFLDPEMFATLPKKGAEVRLTCRVNNSNGSKISLTPMAVDDNNPDESGQEEGAEDDIDD